MANNGDISEIAVNKEVKREIQESGAASEFNDAEKWRSVSVEDAAQTASLRQASPDTAP
jgi:hypothetical protein